MYPTILSRNGLRINKISYKQEILDKVKKDLTVKPVTDNPDEEEYPIYRETPSELIVPRYYGLKKFGIYKNNLTVSQMSPNIQFLKQMRNEQIDILNTCYEHVFNVGGGILSIRCGGGKTVIGIKLAVMLGVKTLVIVNKSFLLNQWIERIKEFTNARIGIIRQDKVHVHNCDIIVGMLKSISMIDYDINIFADIGTVIFDECHNTASRVYSNALYKCGARYTIGLSATVERKDKLTKVIKWYLGDIMYQQKQNINMSVICKIFNYVSTSKLFKEKTRYRNKETRPDTIKMITNLCKLEQRTIHIANIIHVLIKMNRKILILSDRLTHLDDLRKCVEDRLNIDADNGIILRDEYKIFTYVGASKPNERRDAEQNGDILFSTFCLAQEGLDIERLNTVVLATSKKNITQSIGRIMRKVLVDGDVAPLIIDFADILSSFANHARIRQKEYIKNKYITEYYDIRDNDIDCLDDILDTDLVNTSNTKSVNNHAICDDVDYNNYMFD